MNLNYVLKRFLQRLPTLLGHFILISIHYGPTIVDFSWKYTLYDLLFMYNCDFHLKICITGARPKYHQIKNLNVLYISCKSPESRLKTFFATYNTFKKNKK